MTVGIGSLVGVRPTRLETWALRAAEVVGGWADRRYLARLRVELEARGIDA